MENFHSWEEKSIDREVVVAGADTSCVWYDGIIQSTPRYLNERAIAEKIIKNQSRIYNNDRIKEPEFELYTTAEWNSFFNIIQDEFTIFPKSNRDYDQEIISMFKPEDLYWADLANILLANQPWFQQYEKKEFSKIPSKLYFKDLHLTHNQELLELLNAKRPILYHIATDHTKPFANEWATFPPLQTLLATLAKLPVDRQRDIILSTQRPINIPKSYEEIKTVIPGKPWYWQEKRVPAQWLFAKFKADTIDKKWIDPIPEKIETTNKVKSWSNDHDNIIIHYGSEDQRSESNKDDQINKYKNQGRIIYPAN